MGGFIPFVCYMFWIACALGAGVGVAAGGAFVDPVNAVMMSGSLSGKVVQVGARLRRNGERHRGSVADATPERVLSISTRI